MSSDWTVLPKHLWDSILEKFKSSKDYLQFGVVCTQWHDVIKDNQTPNIKLSHQVPMLLIPNEKQQTWNQYDPMHNIFIESKLVIPYDKRFCGSSEGWLVTVNNDFTVTLYKPYAIEKENASIHLPCLFSTVDDDDPAEIVEELTEVCDYHIFKATITADPQTNLNDCIVLVIFGGCLELALIRPAKDIKWTKVDLEHGGFYDSLFYNNEFYIIYYSGKLFSIDISDPCKLKTKLVAGNTPSERNLPLKTYLVKSYEGELLQVERYTWPGSDGKNATIRVKVFKLDFSQTVPTWIEIKNLGDNTLFLGDNTSISVLASDFVGCRPNCIYFTHDFYLVGYASHGPCDLGIYDLKSQSYIMRYPIDPALINRMIMQPPIWILPTLNK